MRDRQIVAQVSDPPAAQRDPPIAQIGQTRVAFRLLGQTEPHKLRVSTKAGVNCATFYSANVNLVWRSTWTLSTADFIL